MIVLAALLSTAQALPWIDRKWLDEQVRREAAASQIPSRPVKLTLPASANNSPSAKGYLNINGM